MYLHFIIHTHSLFDIANLLLRTLDEVNCGSDSALCDTKIFYKFIDSFDVLPTSNYNPPAKLKRIGKEKCI